MFEILSESDFEVSEKTQRFWLIKNVVKLFYTA